MRTASASSVVTTVAALLLTGACTSSAASPGRGALSACTPDKLSTVQPDRLTLSTGVVTRAPWVLGQDNDTVSDPRSGRGYDSAVGFELARRLGFTDAQVSWVAVPFTEAIAAGPKDFDVNVNQATISEDRRADVDLSTPYYVMRQAVVTLSGRPAAAATSLDDLADVTFATVQGTPAMASLTGSVDLATAPVDYPELNEVRAAVSSGRQDALVVDFQTALELDRDEQQLVDGELVGVLPQDEQGAETFGFVLEKSSPLTGCVNAALAAMRADGTLDDLERRWLIEEPDHLDLR